MNRAFSKKPASKRTAFGRPASGVMSDDEAEPVVMTSQQVWNKALSLQGRREHSRAELTQKLKLFGASVVQIEETLVRLAEYSLQSDDRFAESLVRSQLLRGRGQRAIKQVLQQRGLDAEHPALAEQTVERIRMSLPSPRCVRHALRKSCPATYAIERRSPPCPGLSVLRQFLSQTG